MRKPAPSQPTAPLPAATALVESVNRLPNWAVGLFGGLGVLVVGLGVFSLALRPGDSARRPGATPRSAAPRPSARTETLPAAVVDHLAPVPDETPEIGVPGEAPGGPVAGGRKVAGHPEGPRGGRLRRLRAPGAGTDSTGDEGAGQGVSPGDEPAAAREGRDPATDEERAPVATPPVAEVRETPTLEAAEKLQSDMEAILVSLGPKISACAKSADVVGSVEVRVSVGADGAVKASRLLGDVDGTPAAACIQALVEGARYPRFSGASIKLSHRFSVE